MFDISDIQFSVNRAVSSVFGLSGAENEINSLKGLCLSLDTLSLNKTEVNEEKSGINYRKYHFNGDYFQFLENLRRLLILFSQRLISLKSVNSELAHLYIKIFLNITNIFKNNNIAFQTEFLCICIFKIWCSLLCVNNSNKIDKESFEKNKEIFDEYVPLVLNIYKCSKNENEWNKLLYIILEILRNTQNEKLLNQIFESLEYIQPDLNIYQVYPGVVSALVNKIEELNVIQTRKLINTLVRWFRALLEGMNESYSRELNYVKVIVSRREERNQLLEKTRESMQYLIRKLRFKNPEAVTMMCLKCVDYEVLESDLRYDMCKYILESILSNQGLGEVKERLESLSLSSKLIIRDIVTQGIREVGSGAVETFEAYLKISGCFPWEIDEYLVTKFLINNVDLDYNGLDGKVTVNKKYLVDTRETLSQTTDCILEKWEETKSFTVKYFESRSKEQKIGMFSNILAILESSGSITVYVRALQLLNDLALSDSSENESFMTKELIIDLKSAIIANNMFAKSKKLEDALVVNLIKLNLIDIITVMIKRDRGGLLSHRDIETVLFNVIPELNSDYIKVHKSSSRLMRELSVYFDNYVKKEVTEVGMSACVNDGNQQCEPRDLEQQLLNHNQRELFNEKQLQKQEINIEELLEYYTSGLTRKIINAIDESGVADVVYTLTSFNNRKMDIKGIFDLTVQFCKYFDGFTISECSSSTESDLEKRLTEVFYSFNYILNYMERYLIEAISMESNRVSTSPDVNVDNFDVENVMDEDGKGDLVLSIVTLMVTRTRYYISDKSIKIKYLALLALSRALEMSSKNEYIYRIRVHELWDCIEHSLERSLSQYRIVSILLKIYKQIVINVYEFVEKRLIKILETIERAVLEEEQIVGVADETNGTIRYKCYLGICELMEEASKKVLNRVVFSKLMLMSIKIHTPKTSESIKRKLNETLKNLSKKDPTLVRNVLIEINKGDLMNRAFIKYALKKDVKRIYSKPPPQVMWDVPLVN